MGRFELLPVSPRIQDEIEGQLRLEPLKLTQTNQSLIDRLSDRLVMLDGIDNKLTAFGGLPGGGGQPPLRPGEQQQQDAERRWLEARQAPHFEPAKRVYDPSIDGKLETLERFVNERVDRYLKAFNEAVDPKMKAYYRDLYVAMVTDRNELTEWRGIPTHDQKVDLYNRIALEVEIEIKHNVVILRNSGEQWTTSDLNSIDRGLTAAGHRVTLEGDLQMIIKQKEVVGSRGRLSAGKQEDGVISLSDLSKYAGDDVLHQIGLSKVPWGPFQDRIMSDSGWQRVGDQNVPSLARFNHGDVATAKTLKALGVEQAMSADDGQVFRICKKDGHAFILPVNLAADGKQRQVSLRAQDGIAEDFAETYIMFRTDRSRLEKEFPGKYAVMLELEQAGHI